MNPRRRSIRHCPRRPVQRRRLRPPSLPSPVSRRASRWCSRTTMAEEPKKENLAEGTLISHLLELRNRLMRALIAVVILLVPCIYYQNRIFTFVSQPIRDKLPKGVQ